MYSTSPPSCSARLEVPLPPPPWNVKPTLCWPRMSLKNAVTLPPAPTPKSLMPTPRVGGPR
jgi:hypothetical protein